MYTTLLTIILT